MENGTPREVADDKPPDEPATKTRGGAGRAKGLGETPPPKRRRVANSVKGSAGIDAASPLVKQLMKSTQQAAGKACEAATETNS